MRLKNIPKKVKKQIKRIASKQSQEDFQLGEALDYINDYWSELVCENKEDNGSLIGLPNKYIVPSVGNDEFAFVEQYYWDSYFISLGLMGKENEELVQGMLDNMLVLLKRFGLVPNASRMYFTSRSQAPLLTTYIFHIFDNYDRSEEWLEEYIEAAMDEYQTVWMGTKQPHWRQVFHGLSRYYDINALHDLAEAESGWDMTPRFKRKCLDHLPVDLNSMLYKYEMDFARASKILGKPKEAAKWEKSAAKRKKAMDKFMWSKRRSFYYDYDYVSDSKSNTPSLAAYCAMWAGLATEKQAESLVKNLSKFEHSGGLSTTARPWLDKANQFGSIKTQWAYPNGWAPLHYFVIEGLERYGYHHEAEVVAKKWVTTNVRWFSRHGEFLEKYNVVSPRKHPVEGLYPSQTGFGWTNGVLVYLAHKYYDVSYEHDLHKAVDTD